MHAPTDSHSTVVKRILCYLKGTASYGFHITRGSSFALHGFTDADWAGSIDDRKSIGGYLVFFLLDADLMEVRQATHSCSLIY